MAKKKTAKSKFGRRTQPGDSKRRAAAKDIPNISGLPDFVVDQVLSSTPRLRKRTAVMADAESRQRMRSAGVPPENASADVLEAAGAIAPKAVVPEARLPLDIRATTRALEQQCHRFHGAKINLA